MVIYTAELKVNFRSGDILCFFVNVLLQDSDIVNKYNKANN